EHGIHVGFQGAGLLEAGCGVKEQGVELVDIPLRQGAGQWHPGLTSHWSAQGVRPGYCVMARRRTPPAGSALRSSHVATLSPVGKRSCSKGIFLVCPAKSVADAGARTARCTASGPGRERVLLACSMRRL